METVSILQDDGVSILDVPGTRWRNAKDSRISGALQVLGPRPNGRGKYLPAMYAVRLPNGRMGLAPIPPRGIAPELTIPPGTEIVLPRACDWAVQNARCVETSCQTRAGGMYCRDRSHRRMIIGGALFDLERVSLDPQEMLPERHPDLSEPPRAPVDVADLHERTMRRLGGAQ